MSISKKTRFEVFKRDKFTCQYCGQSAPDVTLQVDHIQPKSKGGEDDLLNLVTSCHACNAGKSDRELSDDAVIKQRKKQLDELQERREQLEMMMDWQRSLIDLEVVASHELADLWDKLVPGYRLSDNGILSLRKLVAKFSTLELSEAMRLSASQYLEYESGQETPTHVSVDKAWDYVPRICAMRRKQKEKPYLAKLFYIRGILRNRLYYVREQGLIAYLGKAVESGVPIEAIQDLATRAGSWTQFDAVITDWINEGYHDG